MAFSLVLFLPGALGGRAVGLSGEDSISARQHGVIGAAVKTGGWRRDEMAPRSNKTVASGRRARR
jgi:hypothetical protein